MNIKNAVQGTIEQLEETQRSYVGDLEQKDYIAILSRLEGIGINVIYDINSDCLVKT